MVGSIRAHDRAQGPFLRQKKIEVFTEVRIKQLQKLEPITTMMLLIFHMKIRRVIFWPQEYPMRPLRITLVAHLFYEF